MKSVVFLLGFMLGALPVGAQGLSVYTIPGSFTIYATIAANAGSRDVVVSLPYGPSIQAFSAGPTQPALIGAASPRTGVPASFVITRVVAWHAGAGPGDYVMVGKLDLAGYGGDYLTPTLAYGNTVTDSGWYPVDGRPLFLPGDELHLHATGAGSLVFATIYILAKP